MGLASSVQGAASGCPLRQLLIGTQSCVLLKGFSYWVSIETDKRETKDCTCKRTILIFAFYFSVKLDLNFGTFKAVFKYCSLTQWNFFQQKKTKDCICSLNSLIFTSWYENQKSDSIQSCVNSWYEPINIILDKIFWYNISTVIVTNKKELLVCFWAVWHCKCLDWNTVFEP